MTFYSQSDVNRQSNAKELSRNILKFTNVFHKEFTKQSDLIDYAFEFGDDQKDKLMQGLDKYKTLKNDLGLSKAKLNEYSDKDTKVTLKPVTMLLKLDKGSYQFIAYISASATLTHIIKWNDTLFDTNVFNECIKECYEQTFFDGDTGYVSVRNLNFTNDFYDVLKRINIEKYTTNFDIGLHENYHSKNSYYITLDTSFSLGDTSGLGELTASNTNSLIKELIDLNKTAQELDNILRDHGMLDLDRA